MTSASHTTSLAVDNLNASMAERIAEAMQPIQISLFGSRAPGEADQWSDVDLLVVLDEAPDRRAGQIEIKSLLTDVPIGINVVVTTPGEIVRRGHVAVTVLNNVLEEGQVDLRGRGRAPGDGVAMAERGARGHCRCRSHLGPTGSAARFGRSGLLARTADG